MNASAARTDRTFALVLAVIYLPFAEGLTTGVYERDRKTGKGKAERLGP